MAETRCRICLKESDGLQSIFSNHEDSSPYDKLQQLITDFLVYGLCSICSLCLVELDNCVKFLEKCTRSSEILSEHRNDSQPTRKKRENLDDLSLGLQSGCFESLADNTALLDKNVSYIKDGEASPDVETVAPASNKPCPLCGSKRNCAHKPPVLYTCDICQKVFTKKFNLNIHIKRHLGIREWACVTCGAPQVSQWLATRHCTAAGRRFGCPVADCDRSYTSAHNLTVHIRNHTGDRPHKCSYCGKQFTSKTTLNDHIRIHTGVKPYMCSICGARFATNKLVAHLKTHAPVSRKRMRGDDAKRADRLGMFPCPHCSIGYSHKQSLNRHVRKQHKETLTGDLILKALLDDK